ncbi:MAG: molecular chaperone GrpE [Candidatus Nitrosotenuis sp.]|nr:molecular chaperone GrpE [Candidatus Nitrosotenuis sp.]
MYNSDDNEQNISDVDQSDKEYAELDTKPTIEELTLKLEESQKLFAISEDKLKRSIADFLNLEKKTRNDIENGINDKLDKFLLKFLTIYDDLRRAKDILIKENINAQGLDSILKNIDSLLTEYNISPINALGEIFDPNLHEAISVIVDESLDENTITKEIRKGYISHKRTLRPTLVEISKKQ